MLCDGVLRWGWRRDLCAQSWPPRIWSGDQSRPCASFPASQQCADGRSVSAAVRPAGEFPGNRENIREFCKIAGGFDHFSGGMARDFNRLRAHSLGDRNRESYLPEQGIRAAEQGSCRTGRVMRAAAAAHFAAVHQPGAARLCRWTAGGRFSSCQSGLKACVADWCGCPRHAAIAPASAPIIRSPSAFSDRKLLKYIGLFL